MKKNVIPIIVGKFIGVTFICIAYFLIKEIVLNQNMLLITILYALLSYALIIFGLGYLIPKTIDNNKFLNFLFSILVKPVYLLFLFQLIAAPILTIIAFTGFYIIPTYITYLLFSQSELLHSYTQGAIYLVAVISVLSFAYFGNKIMLMTIDSFKAAFLKKVLIKITTRHYTRLYTYFIMVIMYLLYNFLSFSSITLKGIPIEMLNVTKEVFVTFVAVDSLIQIYLIKRKSNN